MPSTRSSARKADGATSSPAKSPEVTPKGTKRKADSTKTSPEIKVTKPTPKKQKSLEETMPKGAEESNDVKMEDANEATEDKPSTKEEPAQEEPPKEEPSKEEPSKGEPSSEEPSKEEPSSEEPSKDETTTKEEAVEAAEPAEEKKPDANGAAASSEQPIEKSSERAAAMPTSILEKGIIYFFFRARVGIEDPESVGDLQRTFLVLRPLPHGAKLSDGALPDDKTHRLLALPKKTLPTRHSDRFMAFVEKAHTSAAELKESFFKGAEYETKTAGTRQTQPVTPIAEGVYAITSDNARSTHLAYMLTIPTELGEVQTDMGLRSQGSFVMSIKNPQRPGPANAQLDKAPEFPKEILDDFRGLAWAEVRPSWLDYPNAQILLIGEGGEEGLGKAVEPKQKDQKHDKETPMEAMEKLEHEDELRIQHLSGNDSVFDDLKISQQDYPKIPTTW